MRRRRGTLTMVKRPPGCVPIEIGPSPDLFGLTDATSNLGPSALTCGGWARGCGGFVAPRTMGMASGASTVVAKRTFLHEFSRSVLRFFMIPSILFLRFARVRLFCIHEVPGISVKNNAPPLGASLLLVLDDLQRAAIAGRS